LRHHFKLVPVRRPSSLRTGAASSNWRISPDAALNGAADQTYNIVFATRCNLSKVGRGATVAEALETAKREPIVPVEPDITVLDDNRVSFKIPMEAGYGFDEEIETNGPTVIWRS